MNDLFSNLDFTKGKQITGIYMLKIKQNIYIGSSIHIKRRLTSHKNKLLKNKHDNKYLQNLYNKYKKCFYSIVEELPLSINKYDLVIKEKYWITLKKANLNIDDPLNGMGLRKGKPVYQYTLEGLFIKKFDSAEKAGLEGFNPDCIRSCANINAITKSHLGYVWNYKKVKSISYINNNGVKLRKGIILYDLIGNELKRYNSLSDAARELCKEQDKKYESIRGSICSILKGRNRYKRLYGKYTFAYS